MKLIKTAGRVLFLSISLFSLAAFPAYSAMLEPEYPGVYVSNLPTTFPIELLDDDDLDANDDEATTLEDTAVAIDVLANDEGVDLEDFTLSIEDSPENGNATVQSGGTILYTPATGFTGEDEFEYEVCNTDDDDDDDDGDDGDGDDDDGNDDDDDEDCDKADVLVMVELAPVTNEQPIAANDFFSIGQGTQLAATAPGVLANDSDPNDDALSAVLVGSVKNGSLVLNADGSFTYEPIEGFIGVDAFTYQASDGEFLSNPGTVAIEVIDTEPPTVHWLSPGSDGEVIEVGYEMVYLEVDASDNVEIDMVHFFRWNAQNEVFVDIAEVMEPPYAVEFHTSVLNYEWNQILVKIYDTAGNVSDSAFLWLYQTVNGTKVFIPNITR